MKQQAPKIELEKSASLPFTMVFCYTHEGLKVATGSLDNIRKHFNSYPPFHAFVDYYRRGKKSTLPVLLGDVNLADYGSFRTTILLEKIYTGYLFKDKEELLYDHNCVIKEFVHESAERRERLVWALVIVSDPKYNENIWKVIKTYRHLPRQYLRDLKQFKRKNMLTFDGRSKT